jgi:hypothetical protein
VLLWASTLDQAGATFRLKPVFLPFVHRSVRHLAALRRAAPWLTVGQVLDPSLVARRALAGAAAVVLTPSGHP